MKTLITTVLMVLFAFGAANAQWTTQTSGTTQSIYSVSAVSDDVVWACAAGGVVLRTTNGGMDWTSVGAAPVSGDLYNIFGVDESIALVTGSGTTGTNVWRTTNGGATWSNVLTQPGGFFNVIEINAVGGGFIQGDPVGGRWSLWRTLDFGATWDSTLMYLPQAGAEAGWNNSLHVNGLNYWFGTNNSKIYYSANAGLSWTAQNSPQLNTYTVWFNTPLNGVSGGTAGIVTSNGGTNWTTTTIGGTGNISGAAGYGTNLWVVQGTGIYRTTNNSTSWASDFTATGALQDIAISRTGTRLWAVGTTGLIYTNDGVVSVNNISSNVPDRYSLSQNYPNPFNPSTKINFDIVRAGFVSVKVYNSLGQQVADLVNQDMTPGSYQADFDASALTSGIYFYTIKAGDFVETKKMVLMK
ncbi:MAG TPA: T9SS type A sorting domain-containing protein [Ignavibacteria bacterium]|nr:T9SS type A sorting domain-containing protein [Ignavibacteria bacterium]